MNIWVKPLMAVNVFLYRLTRGRLGSKMAGQTVLLLHTIGRKSGKTYLTPLNFYRDGGNYILVASNWGEARNPGWYYNLMQQPEATIEVKGKAVQVKARQATPDEYDRLWRYVTNKNHFYIGYQSKTDRKIPLVILEP